MLSIAYLLTNYVGVILSQRAAIIPEQLVTHLKPEEDRDEVLISVH